MGSKMIIPFVSMDTSAQNYNFPFCFNGYGLKMVRLEKILFYVFKNAVIYNKLKNGQIEKSCSTICVRRPCSIFLFVLMAIWVQKWPLCVRRPIYGFKMVMFFVLMAILF
jgi:hypothetical protein